MIYKQLGNTQIDVSTICLGTMTWGQQNTQSEAFEQLDYALDAGVNFIDCAELYSIPPESKTYGATETIIGNWIKQRNNRDQYILTSKIAGPGEGWIDHIREGKTKYNKQYITTALDNSLKRLKTDYIDLYQLHWPERKTNFFGELGYVVKEDSFTSIRETLEALNEHVIAGKIRHIGLSNETPWGVTSFINAAVELNLPKIVSVQNPYSLLNRSYEIGLAEISWRENCGLLAYSPLGFGTLSGKYLNHAQPGKARITLWPDYSRYTNPQAVAATEKYVALAREHDLDPAQMALAYVNTRPFLTSNIIGATSMAQLKSNIESINVHLSDEVLDGIEEIQTEHPNPSP